MSNVAWVVVVAVLLAVIVIQQLQKSRKKAATNEFQAHGDLQQVQESVSQAPEVLPREQESPSKIVFGESPAEPIVTIESVSSSVAYQVAKPIEAKGGIVGRLSALVQAAPSLLVAAHANGRQLMEVVVNGDLVRAADGNGLRGFAVGPGGIQEHARLFEVGNLQNLINAAAVWQVASVLVAQKHLADISAKLDEIKEGVSGISRFLDNQRRARIQSTYDYLGQARQAIQAGELPDSVRNQLESCERELAEILRHLVSELKYEATKAVEHTEAFGTGELVEDISRKISKLKALNQDLTLCLKTRIAAWYVLSLYPGEPKLKEARRRSIEQGMAEIHELDSVLQNAVAKDISNVKSMWNKDSTLAGRRQSLTNDRDLVRRELTLGTRHCQNGLASSAARLLEDKAATRIFLEFENGVVVGARQGV